MLTINAFLASLPDLGARPQQNMRPVDFTLERMEILMDALGHPERQYPSIHIAGTNGKGSVVAFCVASLRAQGHKVGSFTSPHLAGALAGIAINEDCASATDLEKAFEIMLPHLETRSDWTQFEIVTALAFLHFARAKVDAAVIEVGLGGRLDATNVLAPLVSVITPIDYDHTSILGNSLAEIARAKAGIIKPGVPSVLAPQRQEARASIKNVAEAKGVRVIEVSRDVVFERLSSDLSGQVFWVGKPTPSPAPSSPQAARSRQALSLKEGKGAWSTSGKESKLNSSDEKIELKIRMLGMHQVENAATSFAALQVANQHGLPVSEDSIRRGFAEARWPGRFEVVQTDPPVILDAAHSPAAAQALRTALDEYFPERPIIMVLGVSADKHLAGIIEPLRPHIRRAIATQSTHPRAMPADTLCSRLAALGIQAEAEPDVSRAIARAMEFVKDYAILLVCGSVFLVEAISEQLGY